MSDLTSIEKIKIEKLLGMSSGYVLDFSNRTFENFVVESVGKDIFDEKYSFGSGSKANRLRAFWKSEPNFLVGKLLNYILAYILELPRPPGNEQLYTDCKKIATRLIEGAPVSELSAITPNSEERDFEVLAKSVREAINRNEPETGLDRLHTFLVRYVRVICKKHGISFDRDKPLHSLFGEYVKKIKQLGLIESEMAERILKSSISTMEAFNDVRNNRSLAHDNSMLGYNESLLIFNHVASAIRFITSIEDGAGRKAPQSTASDEIPF